MRERIVEIDHEITGSELIALLHESAEIKRHQPRYNVAQRVSLFSHGLYMHYDQGGYMCLHVKKNTVTGQPLVTFTSLQNGKKFLEYWLEEFQLCQKLCHLHKTESSCFHHSIEKCLGACVGDEQPETYNARVEELMLDLNFNGESFLIVDKGRQSNEFSFVAIDKGQYIGYGYIYRYQLKRNVNNYKKYLTQQENNRDFQSIIKMQLHKNTKLEIYPL